MIINAGNLRALNTSYSTAYNKGFNSVEPTYQRIASRIPSSSKIQEYNWLGRGRYRTSAHINIRFKTCILK